MPQALKTYTVQAPDGKQITLQGPEGASQEEVIAQAQRLYKPSSAKPDNSAILKAQAEKYPTREKFGVDSGENLTDMQVAGEQAKANVVGALQLPENLLKMIANAAKGAFNIESDIFNNPSQAIPRLKQAAGDVGGAVKSAVEPARTLGRNIVALDDAYGTNFPGTKATAPTTEENRTMAEASGANAAAAGLSLLPKVDRLLPKSPTMEQKLMARSAANQTRSLQPTTLEHKAIAQRIAPELAKREVGAGITGKAYDADVMNRLARAGNKLEAVEARITANPADPKFQTPKQPILDEIDKAVLKLKVRGTNVSGHPEAIAALKDMRTLVDQLPDEIAPDQLIQFNRQLDQAVQEAGGFKMTGTSADRIKVQATRGVSNIVRAAKNKLPDPEWKAANKEYALYRNAADIVERRQLNQIGKAGLSLPGRGTLLDDILATWAGHAVGGPIGGASVEAANLIRQSRGFSNVTSRLQTKAAEKLGNNP